MEDLACIDVRIRRLQVTLHLSESMRRTAQARGATALAWLAALPDHIAAVAELWSISVDDALPGGKNAFVAPARHAGGTPAVLKIAPPGPEFAQQLRLIDAAAGQGYVQLHAFDLAHNAALLEPLGAPLAAVEPVEARLEALAAMLSVAWQAPVDATAPVSPGEDKAAQAVRYLTQPWADLAPSALIDAAIGYGTRRAEAFDPDRCVAGHGDPHDHNALAVLQPRPGADTGFVLIDPEGLRGPAAYDLGVVMRGWPEQVLAADDPVALVRGWARRLAELSTVDDQDIWEWAFVERVTSGLYLCRNGHQAEGHTYLDSAVRLLR
jgi:streptomycin 6-kinase